MRLKKVKNAKEIIENSTYYVSNPQENIGKWSNIFENKNTICLEIGMGKGKFIIGMAENFPNINFIGIEKYDSVMVKAIKALEEKDIKNLKFVLMDAENIDNIFEHEIDTLYLNFSDPWPKSKHEKRRLTSSEFLKRYEKIFVGKKKICQKTDNYDFFEFSRNSLIDNGYTIDYLSYDLHSEEDIFNVETEYEEKFASQGVKINKLEASKE